MTKKHLLWLALVFVVLFGVLMVPSTTSYSSPVEIKPQPQISHRQDTWIRALEWCESSGKPEAINPNDLDNTPSYGAFQFKPSTFELFKKKYGVEGELMDRDVQYTLVAYMVLDSDKISFSKQFPWCVKKLGLPPKN